MADSNELPSLRRRGGRRFGGRGGSLRKPEMSFKRSKTDIHSLPSVAKYRDKLRKDLTPAEAAFWSLVKNSKLDGRKFRRQHSIGKYIFDLYCPSEKLAIELDGQRHFIDHPKLNDRTKRKFAESHGIRVLRFENKLVFEETEWVLAVIQSNFGWAERTTRNGVHPPS